MTVQALRVRSSLYIESLFRCHSIYGSHCWAPFLFEIMTIITGFLRAFFIHKGKVFILFLYIIRMMAEAAIILAYLLSQLLLMCVMHIEIKFEYWILHFN